MARISSIRIVLGLAAEYDLIVHQLDFVSAYLNGNVNEEIHMEVPEELADIPDNKYLKQDIEGKVCLLNKSLYGLKQSGRQWYKKLDLKLKELNSKPLNADACVYFLENKGELTLLVIYVDDLILASNNLKRLSMLKKSLVDCFEMKDLGPFPYCLRIEFSMDKKKGEFCMSQKNYTQEVLKRFNMENCKPVATPMNPAVKISKKICPIDEKEKAQMRQLLYRNLVGSLMYLATITRPDITYAVSALSQFNENPGEEHWKAGKRVLRYLKKTIDTKLVLRRLETN